MRMKMRRTGEEILGHWWETHTVTKEVVAADLNKMVIPYIKEHKLTTLDMDNASVQTAQQEVLRKMKVKTTGFASLKIRDADEGGHSPYSPELMLLDASECAVSSMSGAGDVQ